MTKLDGHTDVETDFEAEFLASLDYELNLGANARATWLTGYIQDDSVDVDGDFCIRVLTTQKSDIIRHVYGYLDPVWNVEASPVFVEGRRVRSTFVHAHSYRILQSVRHDKRLEV